LCTVAHFAELTARIENNQGVLQDADAIRNAVARDPEIAMELSTLASR